MSIAVRVELTGTRQESSLGLDGLRQNAGEIKQIEQAARLVLATAPSAVDDPRWIAAARNGWERLPVRLRSAVREFRRDSGPHGSLLLGGFPVPERSLPATPAVPGSAQRRASLPAAMLTAIACGLGDPVSYASEKGGALVHDVVPVAGRESFQGNAGSVSLSFHTENAFHAHRPDFVLLLCLRADHDGIAGLRVACTRTVLASLSQSAREVLASSSFVTSPPPSFGMGRATAPCPVLSGAAEDPDLRVDLAATKPLGSEAAAALAELATELDRTAQTILLRPGNLAIVDNRVAAHGRTSFRPRYDGGDRWLQRVFVSTDLRRSRAWRTGDGHVLAD